LFNIQKIGLVHLGRFLGTYPILIPSSKYFTPNEVNLPSKPAALEFREKNGAPCLRFRWWKVGPLDKDLDESTPRLTGCDLLLRSDCWFEFAASAKKPITFEIKINKQAWK
jgi:hypothetical protein